MEGIENSLYIAQMWHEILMRSTTAEDVEKYKSLMGLSPVEMRIILMTGQTSNLLLREYVEQLHIPKSTLTSIIDRLEKQDYLKRIINTRDKRSFGLQLEDKGKQFLKTYLEYQNMIGKRIIEGLDEQEREQLVGLLSKIASYIIV